MKTKSVWIATTLVVLLSLGVIACSRAKSDAQIIGEVVTKIQADPQVANKQIAVSSSNGVVTLTGSASSDAERAAVANDASQVEGVKTVVNNMLVASVPVSAPAEDVQQQTPAPAPQPEPVRARKPAAYRERQTPKSTTASGGGYALPVPMSTPTSTNTSYVAPANTIPVANNTPAPPPEPKRYTIDPGTTLSIRMIDSINSGRNHPGDMFHATLDSPVMVGETVVIPEGADVIGHVVEVKDAGHFAGKPELALELTNISVNGNKYTIKTDQYRTEGRSRGASTAKTVGTGAAIGGIIGAIAGGGKGAAIGAAAGAGMGGGVQATRKAEEVHIATEALLSFQLQNSLTMTAAPASTRRRLDDSSYSAPPPPDNNNNNNRNYTDYSSDQQNNNNSDRPVLKRRGPGASDQN